jgi:hypothetical protein
MIAIINAPNYKFGQNLKKSAPAGIRAMVGNQASCSTDDPNISAVALLGFDESKPAEVSKEHFVSWLLSETRKDERCTLSFDGIRIEKQESAFGKLSDEMVRRKNEKPSAEDEA